MRLRARQRQRLERFLGRDEEPVVLQAQGAVTGTNFHFQGGIYSQTSITSRRSGGTRHAGPADQPTHDYGRTAAAGSSDFPFITSALWARRHTRTLGSFRWNHQPDPLLLGRLPGERLRLVEPWSR
jgi:hypothetical protein